MKLILEEESYVIRGAIHDVYRELGAGFAESVYQEALELELAERGIPFVSQPVLNITYKGKILASKFKPDLVCFGKIILELKSVKEIIPQHEAQLINYLRASEMRLGFLINFSHHPKAQVKRIVV